MCLSRFSISAFSLIFAFFCSLNVLAALPVHVEQDRYLLAAKRFYDEQRLDKVSEYLDKIDIVNQKPDALFYYLKSEVLASKRQFVEQRETLEKYVELAGKEGEFYAKALNTITDLEDQQIKASKTAVKPELSSAQNTQSTLSQDEYVQHLQKLYLVNDKRTALVTHINTLLGTMPYTGSRLHSSVEQSDGSVTYSISIDEDQQIVTLKKDRSMQPEKLTTQSINIFGKGPWLTHDCQYQRFQCTIRLPDSIDAWLVIGYDEKGSKELVTALEHLIRLLQKSKSTS
jgi:hypothetical protein